MKQSKLFYKTEKTKSIDVESVSHDLLVRAGYIDQLMAGVYTFLPLGFRVLKNIENIIRKNMEHGSTAYKRCTCSWKNNITEVRKVPVLQL